MKGADLPVRSETIVGHDSATGFNGSSDDARYAAWVAESTHVTLHFEGTSSTR